MGQFDALRAKLTAKPQAALRGSFPLDTSNTVSDAPIQPATSTKGATIPPSDGRPGYVVQENFGTEQNAESVAGGRKPIALSRRAGRKAEDARIKQKNPKVLSDIKAKVEATRKNLATTDMRVNAAGEAYEKPEVKIDKPVTLLNSKNSNLVTPNTSAKPADFTEGPFIPAKDAARAMDPGKAEREAKYAADAAQETERNTLLSNEAEINAKEEASGSTIRVKDGVTYDLADRAAAAAEAAATARPTGNSFFKPKLDKQKRPVFKRGADKETKYTINGKEYTKTSKTWEPVGKKVAIEEEKAPSTYDAEFAKVRAEAGIIPASTTPEKTKEELINAQLGPKQDSPEARRKAESSFGKSEGVSSVVSTADELASQDDEPGLSDTSGLSTKADEANPAEYQDNYVDKRPTSPTNQAESIELDPDSEEGQAADEESTYKVIDTPRDRAENEREQSVRKAALEYEKKQAKLNKTRGPRKPKRLDASGNVIPEEVDRGPNFKSQYEGERVMGEVPASKNLLKEPLEEPITNLGAEPDAVGTAGAERARRAQIGTEILESGVSAQMQGPKRRMVKTLLPRAVRTVDNNGKPIVQGPRLPDSRLSPSDPKVLPLRAFEDNSAPGSEAVTINEAVAKASGTALSDDARSRAAERNRTAVVKTGVVDASTTAAGATAGRNEYQQVSDLARRTKFEGKLGDDNVDTRYDKKVHDTAMDLALREGTIKNAGDLDKPEVMTGTGMRQHIAKAYVLHSSGGASDDAETRLDAVTGGPRGSATNITAIAGMHDTIKSEERFNATKMPGTGVTYSMDDSGDNKIDPEKAHFRAKNGAVVPFSEVNHPDHPLKNGQGNLEGSSVPFVGGVPNAKGEMTPPISVHQGWHPTPGYTHPETGKRITLFEKTSVPENAVHEAHVVREAIRTGESLNVTRKKVYAGEDTGMALPSGENVTVAPAAPIKGVSRERHAQTASMIADANAAAATSATAAADAATAAAEKAKADTIAGVKPEPVYTKVEPDNMTAGVTVEGAKGQATSGVILNQGNRLPTKEETALKASAGRGGVKVERSTRRETIAKQKAAAPTMFKPGESVYHPKHGVGTVVSHGIDMGGTGSTTAVVKFGEKEKSFTGDNIHTNVTDKQGKTTRNQELSRYTPASTPATVTHAQHGSGAVLGYISNTDGSGKTHVKFDSGSTRVVTDNKVKFND